MSGSKRLTSRIFKRGSSNDRTQAGESAKGRRRRWALASAVRNYVPELLERRLQLSAFTPAQMRQAYGIDQISLNGTVGDGSGQTIAIVIPYLTSNLNHDVYQFGQLNSIPINAAGQPTTSG